MKKDTKDKIIAFRVTNEEKDFIENLAKKHNFHSVAQFILWFLKTRFNKE